MADFDRLRRLARSLAQDLGRHRRLVASLLVVSLLLMLPYGAGAFASPGSGFDLRALYLALALCLLGVLSRIAFAVSTALLLLATIVTQHVGRHWGLGQVGSRLEAFYESPTGETVEYLRSHVDVLDFACIVGSVLFLYVVIRLLRRSAAPSAPLRAAAALALLAWCAGALPLRMDNYVRYFPPVELAYQLFDARHRYELLARRADNLKLLAPEARSCTLRYDTIVVVLGESAVSDHMSVFGYPKPTTPFADASHPYAFDALSPANQTRYALAMMLTDATPEHFDRFFEARSLVGELKDCGMETLWISNQGRRGQYDSFSTSLALEADEQQFLNEWSWEDVSLDGRLADALEARPDSDHRGQAIFVHLIGSHTMYSQRYPKGFGFPDTSDIVAQYDNSLRYTDSVLERLYRHFAGEKTLFVYVSDHGQIVSNEKFGSGFLPGFREEYRTPLLVWTADDASIARVRETLGGEKLNLESFDDLVRYLAGISPEPRLSTRKRVAVLSPDYLKDYDSLRPYRRGSR
jgi:glucan phosphoethanolaminetransferase (alkaline phosphatase superfamily)